jgi:hypothetical protein
MCRKNTLFPDVDMSLNDILSSVILETENNNNNNNNNNNKCVSACLTRLSLLFCE